jgi:hypothetical protein
VIPRSRPDPSKKLSTGVFRLLSQGEIGPFDGAIARGNPEKEACGRGVGRLWSVDD